jgi:hypothetical protein
MGDKPTLETFKAKLKDGGYKNTAGARRGLGRMHLKATDKEKANKAIDSHFGPKKKKSAPKKSAAKPKAAPKKRSKAKTPMEKRSEHLQRERDVKDNPLAAIQIVNKAVGTVNEALDSMKDAFKANPELNVTAAMQVAVETNTECLEHLRNIIREMGTKSKGNSSPDEEDPETKARVDAAFQRAHQSAQVGTPPPKP